MTTKIANVDEDIIIPDRRPMVLKLSEKKNEIVYKNLFNPPVTLGVPKKDNPEHKRYMAMDACVKNVLSNFKNDSTFTAFPSFVGYALLSNVSQEALIRAGVETVADEMTRKPVELYYDDDDNEDAEKLINDLNSDLVKYRLKAVMNDAMIKDGFFGGCLVYIDVGDIDDEEKAEPLNLDKRTFKKGSLRGFKVIEPINIAPGEYNTTDPTDEHYFNPEWWYILGKRYHASRFLYIASNDAPDILKPAYNFFGIPQAQLALDYVANFVANRESAQELLNKFSLTCFGTDMSQGLQANGSWSDLINRMRLFNKMKTNNGTFVYNKETEEMTQINTPLSGVRDIVEMSLNLLTAVWRIPKIKYIGEGEGGLNASSQEQMRSYYDYIHGMQEKVFTEPYAKVIKLLQLNRGLEPDEKLLFKFPPLWDMDENERAQLNKTLADRAAIYIANGVISQEEERRRLSLDRNSGYSDIDVDDLPEVQEQPLPDAEKEEQDEEDRQAMDEWVDREHPRDEEGKFTGKQVNFKMTKSRMGFTRGPLPSITDFTDYSTSNEINLYWNDDVKNENVVKKHIETIIKDYAKYEEKKANYIISQASIKKDDFGYSIRIKCDIPKDDKRAMDMAMDYDPNQKRGYHGRWTKWDSIVDSIFDGTYNGKEPVLMNRPNKLWLNIGLKDEKVVFNHKKIKKVIGKHKLTKEELKELPYLFANPDMIFKSKTDNRSFVAILKSSTRPLIAAVMPLDDERDPRNVIKSAYKKDENFIERETKAGRLLHKKTEETTMDASFADILASSDTSIITDNGYIVNIFFEDELEEDKGKNLFQKIKDWL